MQTPPLDLVSSLGSELDLVGLGAPLFPDGVGFGRGVNDIHWQAVAVSFVVNFDVVVDRLDCMYFLAENDEDEIIQ